MQVNPEKAVNVIGLLKDHTAVSKADMLARMMPHFADRILAATLRRVAALDLRGNVALQDKVQAEVMSEVERIAGDLGLMARAVSLKWAFNEDEIAAIQMRAKQREADKLEQDARLLNREIARDGETTVLRIRTDISAEQAKAASDADLRRLVLDREIDFIDARETGVRLEQMKVLEQELALNNAERRDRLMQEMEAADQQTALATKTAERQIDAARKAGEQQTVDLANADVLERSRIKSAKLRGELRVVEREIDEGDVRSRLNLAKLEAYQAEELRKLTRGGQLDDLTAVNTINQKERERLADLERSRLDADVQRTIAQKAQDNAAQEARIKLLSGLSPEAILAVQAGLSPEVANILGEQARARGGEDRMGLMREMIAMAQGARLDSEAQARDFFGKAMLGAAGVAQGVGAAAGHGIPPDAPARGGEIECGECHKMVSATDRFCKYCRHQLRA